MKNLIPKKEIKRIKKQYPQGISNIGETYITSCEWCTKTTQVTHISLNKCSYSGISYNITYFKDKNFHLQSEWWVCGKCKDS